MKFQDFKMKLLKDLAFRKEYERFDLGLWIRDLLIKRKIKNKSKVITEEEMNIQRDVDRYLKKHGKLPTPK